MAAKKKSAKKTSITKRTTVKSKPTTKKKHATKKPRLKTKRAPAKRVPAKKAVAKKAVAKPAKKAVAKPAKRAPAKKAVAKPAKQKTAPRRDATGHLDAQYASELRARSVEGATSDGDQKAFLSGPRSGDTLAEGFGEEAVHAMTSGENEGDGNLDQVVSEEIGGPFVETTANQEFALGTDESNPKGAKREPFPRT